MEPKYSRWLSTDPALGEYIPKAPINEEAKRYNQNLPGIGGVFNHINGNLYHYAGNNPVRYIDPDGRTTADGEEVSVIIFYDRKDQAEFKFAAETAANKYSNKNNTYIIGVYTASDFKTQWNRLNEYFSANDMEVDNMEIFCHGDAYNLYFKNSDLHCNDVTDLSDFSFSKDAKMILHSCNSGTSQSGISQAFANKENISVEGQAGYANFSSNFQKFRFIFKSKNVYLEVYNRTKNNSNGDGSRLDRIKFKKEENK